MNGVDPFENCLLLMSTQWELAAQGVSQMDAGDRSRSD